MVLYGIDERQTQLLPPQNLEYASFGMRLAAHLLDLVVVTVSLLLFNLVAQFAVGMAAGLANRDITRDELVALANGLQCILFIFGLVWLAYYYVWVPVKWGGRTLGKNVFLIQIVRLDGRPITYDTMVLRHVLGYFISSVPFGLGHAWIILDDNNQSWHDKITDTAVVTTQRHEP